MKLGPISGRILDHTGKLVNDFGLGHGEEDE
jgi:hypothetical protein